MKLKDIAKKRKEAKFRSGLKKSRSLRKQKIEQHQEPEENIGLEIQ